jgi:hypothetical protein
MVVALCSSYYGKFRRKIRMYHGSLPLDKQRKIMHMRTKLTACQKVSYHTWNRYAFFQWTFPHRAIQKQSAIAQTFFSSSKITEPIDWLEVEFKAKTSKVDKLKSFNYSLEPGLDRSIEYFSTEYGLDDPDRAVLEPVEEFLRYIYRYVFHSALPTSHGSSPWLKYNAYLSCIYAYVLFRK